MVPGSQTANETSKSEEDRRTLLQRADAGGGRGWRDEGEFEEIRSIDCGRGGRRGGEYRQRVDGKAEVVWLYDFIDLDGIGRDGRFVCNEFAIM